MRCITASRFLTSRSCPASRSFRCRIRDSAPGAKILQAASTNVGERTVHYYTSWEYPSRGMVRIATWPRDRLGFFSAVSKPVFQGQGYQDIPVEPHTISCPVHARKKDAGVYINVDGLGEYSRLAGRTPRPAVPPDYRLLRCGLYPCQRRRITPAGCVEARQYYWPFRSPSSGTGSIGKGYGRKMPGLYAVYVA